MQFTHTMHDVEVFHVEGLDIVGERVVIGTLTCFEVRCRIGVGIGELRALRDNLVDGGLQRHHLVMVFNLAASFEELLEFAEDEVSLTLRVETDVAVHNRVVGELEKEDRASVPILLLIRRFEKLTEFVGEVFVHIRLVLLNLIVDTSEEHTILVVFGEERAHCFERGASGDEVVEHDAVGFGGENIEREHRPDALLGMAECHILVERDS